MYLVFGDKEYSVLGNVKVFKIDMMCSFIAFEPNYLIETMGMWFGRIVGIGF